MTDKKAIDDILANTPAEVRPETLSDKLTDVKAAKLDKKSYYAIERPSQLYDSGRNATIRHKSS